MRATALDRRSSPPKHRHQCCWNRPQPGFLTLPSLARARREFPVWSYFITQAFHRFSGGLKPQATWAARRSKVQLVQTSYLQSKNKSQGGGMICSALQFRQSEDQNQAQGLSPPRLPASQGRLSLIHRSKDS